MSGPSEDLKRCHPSRRLRSSGKDPLRTTLRTRGAQGVRTVACPAFALSNLDSHIGRYNSREVEGEGLSAMQSLPRLILRKVLPSLRQTAAGS